jgi:uncharacterized protein YbjT (DUF2867 family)
MGKKSVAVCGATGLQGGSVVREMIRKADWEIIALTRNPDAPKSKALGDASITVVQADLDNRLSLTNAFQGVQGVFGVTQPWSPDYKKCDPRQEVMQGHNIVNACFDAGVSHLVLSTAAHVKEGITGIPHVDSKLEVEAYAQEKGLPYTFLQPTQFMDNLGKSYFPVKRGVIRGFVDGDVKVPYIATRDIGVFAGAAFNNPDNFVNRQLTLVGDFISGFELSETLERIQEGKTFKYKAIPRIIMRLFAKEFYAMRVAFEEFGRPPYAPEVFEMIENCRRTHPGVMSFEQYLLSFVKSQTGRVSLN